MSALNTASATLMMALLAGGASSAGETAAHFHDWTGYTAGVIGSFNSGTDSWDEGGWVDYPLEDAGFLGVFVGYDQQFGDLVVGGRASVQFGSMKEKTDEFLVEYNRFYDFNGRLGYAMDHLLVYATAGYSIYDVYDSNLSFEPKGYNIGVGAQYALQENIVVGVEYLHREFDTECPHDNMGYKQDIDSVQLSVGYKF